METKVRELIGPRAIVKEDGQKVYDLIHPALAQGDSATVDFEGVAQFASPFFNYAIGQLLKDLTIADLRQRLHVLNLSADGKAVLSRVVENASRDYADSDYSRIVDSILEEQSKESD